MNILNKEKILEQARAFIGEGKYDKAIREYEKILLADPGDLRVKLRVAELYIKRKQVNDAIRLYREVADAYASEGFFLKAVTVHKGILRLNPSMIEINEQLAILYEKMGLISDAVRQYDILASALDSKGIADRVLEIRARIVRLKPSEGSARIRLAELYQREGRMDEAIDQYEEYAKQLEGSGESKTKLADLYEKILTHRPDRHEMLRKLVDIHNELGDKKKALKWLEAGREFVDSNPELLRFKAEIYASQNQNESARTKYLQLADLEKEAGNIEAALEAYYEILVLLPDEEERLAKRVDELKPGALAELSARAQKRREELEAEESKRQAEEDGEEADMQEGRGKDEEEKMKTVEMKAKAFVEDVPKPESKGIVEKERRPNPKLLKDADAAFDLGMAYRKMGLSEESKAEFKKAKDIYDSFSSSGNGRIKERLRSIDTELGMKRPTEKAPEGKKPAPESKPSGKKKISYV